MRREEVRVTRSEAEKLIEKLASAVVKQDFGKAITMPESRLEPYKANQAWPGRAYNLIGNSYNLESKILETTSDTKRTACIAVVLERGRSNRKCVSIEDAFAFPGFEECLSRFEKDWLFKQPPSTLIGPAYDQYGRQLPESFAVWKREASPKKLHSEIEPRLTLVYK